MVDFEAFRNFAQAIQAGATAISLAAGGIWVYWRYIRQHEKYPHIESSAEVIIIGEQDDSWIVELAAILENKGKAPHNIKNFDFDLNALMENDRVEVSEKWGGQVHFPNSITKGSFIPERAKYFFIDPQVNSPLIYPS